ncbi:MAG: DUF3151 domain-containing protein [Egibacteraceae bacterium]
MSGLPLHGVRETLLSPEPQSAVEGLAHALTGSVEDQSVIGARLRDVVAAHPAFLDGWAHLAKWALDEDDPVAAYAFARTGYHRGLDGIRKAGWGGQGPVPWRHEPNRGFLRSVHALMLAATLIGERDEAERCRDFLLQLDPDDALAVRDFNLG